MGGGIVDYIPQDLVNLYRSGGTGLALGAGGFGFTGGTLAAIGGNIGIALVLSGVSGMYFPYQNPRNLARKKIHSYLLVLAEFRIHQEQELPFQ